MKTEYPAEQPQFQAIVGREVVTRFDGGTLTSHPLLAAEPSRITRSLSAASRPSASKALR
jgi:hypothetical protein